MDAHCQRERAGLIGSVNLMWKRLIRKRMVETLTAFLLILISGTAFSQGVRTYVAENTGTGDPNSGANPAYISVSSINTTDTLRFKTLSGKVNIIMIMGKAADGRLTNIQMTRGEDVPLSVVFRKAGRLRALYTDLAIKVNGDYFRNAKNAAKVEVSLISTGDPSGSAGNSAQTSTSNQGSSGGGATVSLITQPRKGGVVAVNYGTGVRSSGGAAAIIHVPVVTMNMKLTFESLSGSCSFIAVHGIVQNDRNKAIATDGDLLYKGPMKELTLYELHKNKAYYAYYKVYVNGFYSGYDKTPASVEILASDVAADSGAIAQGGASGGAATGSFKTRIVGGMEFVYIPEGCFLMGSRSIPMATPEHKVCLKGFWMGKYEVTQQQWVALMGTNPSYFKRDGLSLPVEQISWNDAQSFIAKFNVQYKVRASLPSEAQWEYACRAGSTTRYYWGDVEDGAYMWYDRNANFRTHPVGQKKPNAFGLYDMAGNVSEYVQDCFNYSYAGAPTDGNAWNTGRCDMKVHRGGSASHKSIFATSADRQGTTLGKVYTLGFRIIIPE